MVEEVEEVEEVEKLRVPSNQRAPVLPCSAALPAADALRHALLGQPGCKWVHSSALRGAL